VKRSLSACSALALVVLACGYLASSAAAVGIQSNRVVARHPVSTSQRATAATADGGLIAPATVCPRQEDLEAPVGDQEKTMACMVNFARRESGLGELTEVDPLIRSAADKSNDVLSCDSFSHFACGREFTYWMKEVGYMSAPCWHVGENLAWGTEEYGTVRSIFIAWMRSPDHRANILGDFAETGLSLEVGDLEGEADVHIWAEHFGSHCA